MTWTFEADSAMATCGAWKVRVNPNQPTHGLMFSQSKAADWTALTVNPLPRHDLQLEECYVRGTDLIVRFAQSADDQFAFQLNWRLLPAVGDTDIGIEMWVSVQTDLLDSQPALVISSESPRGESWESLDHRAISGETQIDDGPGRGPAALISRTDSSTAVWLIEPTDRQNVEVISSPGESQQRLELFSHFMEKGVIRRARMRFFLVTGDLTRERLRELYQAFSESPLPLTA